MSTIQTSLGHLKHHIEYPASRTEVVEACNGMEDLPAEDRAWFGGALPEGNYGNAEDVVKALLQKV